MKQSVKQRHSVLYEQTPILYGLPPIGTVIKVFNREFNPTYVRDNRIRSEYTYKAGFSGKELEVYGYTHGEDNPLAPYNKCLCYYKVGDIKLTTCIPTISMSVGVVRWFSVFDKEQEREFESITRKA